MKVFITGGCGFIGSNAAAAFARLGHQVTLFDDLSRVGADLNLQWLQTQGSFQLVHGDIRNFDLLCGAIQQGGFDAAIHLAGQVAVTTSITDPVHDFEVNARGTFNVLEAIRRHSPETIVLNASTNKVYGKLGNLRPQERPSRYELPDLPHGVNEAQPLDFHSPYGCSKGSADQYVMDYARIYGLRTVNFRQSCIYGYRQFGIEDQGWVAWFLIAHSVGRTVTIYGDGKQVRDILFVDDLINAYVAAIRNIDAAKGLTFNVGGGPDNTLSLLELLEIMERLSGRKLAYDFSEWRAGDQAVYVSDIRRAGNLLGWKPAVTPSDGVAKLYGWIESNRALFQRVLTKQV